MKSKVLIIGGAGFIGYNIANYLLENRNYQITIADNLSRGQMDEYLTQFVAKEDVEFIEGDFTNPDTFNLLENEYKYVYMLASVVGVDNVLEAPHEVIRINTSLILNTLEWLKKSQVEKVVFTSTSENYAGTIDYFNFKIPTAEDVPLTIVDISHPRYAYAVTKILGESSFLNYSNHSDFDCSIVRYHNVIGPRMGFKHVIPHLVERFLVKKENPFLIYGHSQTRAFCYISDAVEGTILAMESEKSNGEIYHIGTEEEISIDQLVRETGSYFNFKGSYENAPTFPGSTQRRCPDIKKAFQDLGYQPKIPWKEGLISTIKWYEDFYLNGGLSFEKSFQEPET